MHITFINARDACQAVQRLSDVLAQHSILTPDGTELHITFSAGVVDAGSQATLDAMYREADQALYKAKHEGRNRVQIF
ncbi:diguanylate cyclase [Methylophaga sp.]|uniref:GGDEF domain-containing protein n=1 Tax=Methylophaga sp. TaxID=2024840 RepID=UPI0027230E4E|nr:diguanylate cyclase [Methylophaga sp.]MDO8825754.1 diguanylate cyclase [Methylophaga sp.]